jgi:hypothetical protein
MRTFTYQEAEWHLPIVSGLLQRAMEAKRTIQEVEREMAELHQRVFLAGGLLPDIRHFARRRAQRDKAVQQIKDAVGEIQAIGVQVKDLDTGLVDFPCKIDGEIVLLCWKSGEESITHWHGLEEGFRGRKPIDDAIRRGTRLPN